MVRLIILEKITHLKKVSIQLLFERLMMEEDHQRGLSHLIEHMAFNGSKFSKKKYR